MARCGTGSQCKNYDHPDWKWIVWVCVGTVVYQLVDIGFAAGSIAIVNPLIIQDINKLGLRQTLLWWMLLFPALLQRAARTGSIFDGILVGACFSLIAAFYWFYGLFAGMFGVVWLLWFLWKHRPPFSIARR